MDLELAGDSKRRILIVDDDLSLLQALERALAETDGYDIVASDSFEDARRTLRSRKFDVLITDVRLGPFNGLQLAILARDLHPDIRLIVISGFDDTVLKSDARRLGAVFLVKPVTTADLLTLIG